MFSTNVTGLINMTQAVLPIFQRRDNGGRGDIINIGSIAGRDAYVGGSIYCATKAAVRTFTDALRRELIATRIRVMEIDPGQVETVSGWTIKFYFTREHYLTSLLQEFSVVRFYGDKSKADAVYAYVFNGPRPLTGTNIAKEGYSGCEPLTPDDIAEIVVFTAGRPENVVIAESLIFPSHQVCTYERKTIDRTPSIFLSIQVFPQSATSFFKHSHFQHSKANSSFKAAATVLHKRGQQ